MTRKAITVSAELCFLALNFSGKWRSWSQTKFEVNASLTLTVKHIVLIMYMNRVKNTTLFTSHDSPNRIKQLLDYETTHSTVLTLVFIYDIYFTKAVKATMGLCERPFRSLSLLPVRNKWRESKRRFRHVNFTLQRTTHAWINRKRQSKVLSTSSEISQYSQ